MRRILLVVITILIVKSERSQHRAAYIGFYERAEKLYYDDTNSDAADSLALENYRKVIQLHPQGADSILWDSYLKAGVLLQTAGKFSDAIPYLSNAVKLQTALPAMPEHLFYLPNLYLGNSYYDASMLDSASFYYKRAEQLATRHPETKGVERLYNTLGAISYESADYNQARLYFEKALEVLGKKSSDNIPLLVNYQNNLAAAYRQLKQFDKAMETLTGLLKYNINRNELIHNIGSIYLEEGKDSLAIAYLSKVGNSQVKYNDLAAAYMIADEPDSALFYYRKAIALNQVVNGDRKNIAYAITCKKLGDYFVSVKNYDSALIEYHQAVVQLVFDFDNDDIRLNPVEFNGQYAVNELFEALSSKAKTFTLRYQADHNKNDLLSSIFAYDALYRLADYVTRNYTTEQARQLLLSRKYLSHSEPIDNSIKLFEITGDSVYVRHAFRFDEKNKATLLALQLQENISKEKAGLPRELLQKEKALSREITALSLDTTYADSVAASQREDELREKQIELVNLHKKFDQHTQYHRLKYIDNTITAQDAMKKIPSNYAVVSYHVGDTNVVMFVITKHMLKCVRVPKDSTFGKQVLDVYKLAQVTDRNVTSQIDTLARKLYGTLIEPIRADIASFHNLLIIPDDELLYLPFEIISGSKNSKLLEKHAITYNYSVSLLKNSTSTHVGKSILAVAPFTNSLPASMKEIESIRGRKMIDTAATKENFIRGAPSYSVIHLATHAVANDSDPAHSYISFYTSDSATDAGKLYAPEIANLQLNKVSLVVLSACETATGQLVKGEGLMSITRSFSNAGCRNTIASLWKADDVSTYRISEKLHYYLKKGKTPADALRLAKLDYLEDSEVPARLKTPAYWAHLRLLGTFEKSDSNIGNYVIVALAFLALVAFIYFSMRRSSPSSKTSR